MENLDDEEIQRLIEEQLKGHRSNVDTEGAEDAALYRLLFAELNRAPLQNINSEIPEKVVRKIELKRENVERVYYAVSVFAILLLFSALVYGAIAWTEDSFPDQLTLGLIALS